MIRKSGWIIFLVFLALIFLFVYLLAGFMVRSGLTYGLERVMGAEVNIDKASLGLAPLALNIHSLQITDKEKPTHNVVSFTNANASLELWPALLGYYVVNELYIDDLEFGGERAAPGKVFERPESKTEKTDIAEKLKVDLPDSNELFSRANLTTNEKGAELEALAKKQQERIKQLESKLPDKSNLTDLEGQITALTDSKIQNAQDLAKKAEQLKTLKTALKEEQQKLKAVEKELRDSRDKIKTAVEEVRAAHAEDWEKLKKLANIGDGGLAPMSQLLLGDYWGERIAQFEAFYKLAKPYLPNDFPMGGDSSAEETHKKPNRILPLTSQPYPNFWVKEARIGWLVAGGEAMIQGLNLTSQHDIIDDISHFSVDVNDFPKLEMFALKGDFAVLEHMETNVSWDMSGYKLEDFVLGGGDSLLQVAAGVLGAQGTLKLVDQQVEQQGKLMLNNAVFKAGGGKVMQQLAELLNRQQQIPFSLSAKGLVSNPDVSVRSNLDRIVGDAILGEAKEKAKALEKDLRSELDSQLAKALGSQNQWAETYEQQSEETKALDDRIEGLLNAQLASLKDSAKDRLKEKLLMGR